MGPQEIAQLANGSRIWRVPSGGRIERPARGGPYLCFNAAGSQIFVANTMIDAIYKYAYYYERGEMNMTLSDAMLAKIAQSEGFQPECYDDHRGKSIGYGHRILPGEAFPDPLTEWQARKLLRRDLNSVESDVQALIKAPLTQDQYDALVDFRYNCGRGPLEMVAETFRAGLSMKAVAEHIKLYNEAIVNGKLQVIPGLVARRAEEAKAFEDTP